MAHGLTRRALVRLALGAGLVLAARGPAGAAVAVGIELALGVDCSFSVNDLEYELQMQGIADAFRDPEVISLIGNQPGGIAVTLYHWAGTPNNIRPIPWRHLTDEASALAFAAEVASTKRSPLSYYTAIGHAIDFGVHLIETSGFAGHQRKIDISGDGRNNTGPEPSVARLRALAKGITVNGLAILDGDRRLAGYYRDNVIIGPSAFVMTAGTYDDFAAAMRNKLLRELIPHVVEGPREIGASPVACRGSC